MYLPRHDGDLFRSQDSMRKYGGGTWEIVCVLSSPLLSSPLSYSPLLQIRDYDGTAHT